MATVLLLTPLSAVQAKSLVPNVTVLQAAGADQMEAGKDTGHPQVELDQLTDAGEPARNRHHKQKTKIKRQYLRLCRRRNSAISRRVFRMNGLKLRKLRIPMTDTSLRTENTAHWI